MIATHDAIAVLRAEHLARNKRREVTALSLEAAWWIADWMDDRLGERQRPLRVLDLGSGFSTTFFRSTGVGCEVVTTDDDWRWLGAAMEEIARQFGTPHWMLHHDVFTQLAAHDRWAPFDLVLLDLGEVATRAARLDGLAPLVAEGGILYADDWHCAHLAEPARAWAAAHGWTVTPLPETTDVHGRFGCVFARGPEAR